MISMLSLQVCMLICVLIIKTVSLSAEKLAIYVAEFENQYLMYWIVNVNYSCVIKSSDKSRNILLNYAGGPRPGRWKMLAMEWIESSGR
jgi:hypothetical protein